MNCCECGSYKCQIVVECPEYETVMGRKLTTVGIDKCILKEMQYLWNQGIKTLGCCCGHKVQSGYIQVKKSSIEKMKELGYELESNDRQDVFIPKSM